MFNNCIIFRLGEITTFLPNTISKSDDTDIVTTIQESPKIEFENAGVNEKTGLPVKLSNESFCQKYHGKRCKDYLEHMTVFVQPPYTQDEIEEKLDNAFIVISQSKYEQNFYK